MNNQDYAALKAQNERLTKENETLRSEIQALKGETAAPEAEKPQATPKRQEGLQTGTLSTGSVQGAKGGLSTGTLHTGSLQGASGLDTGSLRTGNVQGAKGGLDPAKQKEHVKPSEQTQAPATMEERVARLEGLLRGMRFSSPDSSIQISGQFPNFVVKTRGASHSSKQTELS